jgi:hypothetical protein
MSSIGVRPVWAWPDDVSARYVIAIGSLQTYRKVRTVLSCAEDLGFDDQLADWLLW